MKNIYVVWIHTYNLECLEYCLHTFEERTDYTSQPYRHFIVDSSIGKQDEVKLWLEKENRERLHDPKKPPIECHFCDEHLGPTSKRNIAFSLLKGKYDFLVEMEDDVTIGTNTNQWLKMTTDGISEFESQGQSAFFDFNFGMNPPEFTCAGSILSCKTRDFLGNYPSQISGDFINLIEELVLFPRYLQKRLCVDNNLIYIGAQSHLWLEFDLASISSNYIIEFRKTYDERCINNLMSSKEYEGIYKELYARFINNPRPTRAVFEEMDLHRDMCIEKLLILKNKTHWLLKIEDYRKYERSICLTQEEFSVFQKELNSNPEVLISLISQKAIMEEEGLFLINSLDKDIINLKESLPEAFRVLIKYAK
ncbi:MAG: hypothetical protein DKM50_06915 [Candidatus Margulisiibacteriota bacterium]|nr:MAG: hypothetical protein A2X43_10870 [Candidatus Margulisbacteria bacterium GWD2_39_127]PZM79905.1 MAG: hypothetical protein DKM50_06915 [Candidatus Margulisiibacteriota bacterium]HAR62823.1 hypothetical protein [Candidatus Margulisiibacteriota bacterium]HCY35651.1 hypothetical protein [Candidatus Margulisiibacteriota bacterium]